MLTFSELYATALPGTKGPRSARTLCGLYKTRGLDFRTIATAVGTRQCAIQVQLYNPSILASTNFATDSKLPSSRPTIAQIQSLNAKLTPQGLTLKLVSKDLSQAVLVGTWNAVADLIVSGVYTGPNYGGPNLEVKIGDAVMAAGAVMVGVGWADAGTTVVLGGGLFLLGMLLAWDGGFRLDNPPPPESGATAPSAPPPATDSNSHDTVEQNDDSGPAQDPATLPNCTLFGIVPDGLSADQVVNAIANELGIGDTTGWGGSDTGGFLTGGLGDDGGDPTSGGGLFGGGGSGGLLG